jgi:2-polyprenyl-6-methoxyphenol hydroxylase-like FAD-dependent oxidoreductase
VRIGDAAVMIPPFTGNGMTMALQSALGAVDPLASWSSGDLSWNSAHKAIRASQGNMFTSRVRWAQALQWLLLRPLGRRLCSLAIDSRLVSFERLYRKMR